MSRVQKDVTPNFRTPEGDLSAVERAKAASNYGEGHLYEDFRDATADNVESESEEIAKSHGIYLEWNRAKTGRERDWMYMLRVSVPGGGPFTRDQWRVLDDLAERYTVGPEGRPSLRLTTRQNIQFHWVRKHHIIEIVRAIASTGFYTLNGCGDNTRNVVACPLTRFSTVFDANALAQDVAEYFRLPAQAHIKVFAVDPNYIRTPGEHYDYGPRLMNRKFKIAFSALHYDAERGAWAPDNCVEVRTNDVGVVPILEHGRVDRFQVYIGGGQGEKWPKPTFAALGQPFGIFTRDRLREGLHAIAKVHEEWGDRQNRHWARLKYVVHKLGVEWFRERVRERGIGFDLPDPHLDYGDRPLHHGWHLQPSNGLLAYGAFIENGRLMDGPNERLKTMVRHLMDTYPVELMTTANQDLLFTNIPPGDRERFAADMASFGYGVRHGQPYSALRRHSVACVGLDTCKLAYTDSERFLPEVLDELERRGWGDLCESVGMSGCERQCSRPSTKTIGWTGSGKNQYQLRVFGQDSGRTQGIGLIDDDVLYLRRVPREHVVTVTSALFEFYRDLREPGETMGRFHRRVGAPAIVRYLKDNPATAPLMEKTDPAPHLPAEPELHSLER